jgi:hypothetical protein
MFTSGREESGVDLVISSVHSLSSFNVHTMMSPSLPALTRREETSSLRLVDVPPKEDSTHMAVTGPTCALVYDVLTRFFQTASTPSDIPDKYIRNRDDKESLYYYMG